jgi:hypothetical protein
VCCNPDVKRVQKKTAVTNAFKGEDLSNYLPLFKKYNIPVLPNFQPGDMTWIKYQLEAKILVLDKFSRKVSLGGLRQAGIKFAGIILKIF